MILFEQFSINISVLLRHSGVRINDIKYEGYKSDVIVVGEHVTHEKLIFAIAVELEIDESRKKFEAQNIIDDYEAPC